MRNRLTHILLQLLQPCVKRCFGTEIDLKRHHIGKIAHQHAGLDLIVKVEAPIGHHRDGVVARRTKQGVHFREDSVKYRGGEQSKRACRALDGLPTLLREDEVSDFERRARELLTGCWQREWCRHRGQPAHPPLARAAAVRGALVSMRSEIVVAPADSGRGLERGGVVVEALQLLREKRIARATQQDARPVGVQPHLATRQRIPDGKQIGWLHWWCAGVDP